MRVAGLSLSYESYGLLVGACECFGLLVGDDQVLDRRRLAGLIADLERPRVRAEVLLAVRQCDAARPDRDGEECEYEECR